MFSGDGAGSPAPSLSPPLLGSSGMGIGSKLSLLPVKLRKTSLVPTPSDTLSLVCVGFANTHVRGAHTELQASTSSSAGSPCGSLLPRVHLCRECHMPASVTAAAAAAAATVSILLTDAEVHARSWWRCTVRTQAQN